MEWPDKWYKQRQKARRAMPTEIQHSLKCQNSFIMLISLLCYVLILFCSPIVINRSCSVRKVINLTIYRGLCLGCVANNRKPIWFPAALLFDAKNQINWIDFVTSLVKTSCKCFKIRHSSLLGIVGHHLFVFVGDSFFRHEWGCEVGRWGTETKSEFG